MEPDRRWFQWDAPGNEWAVELLEEWYGIRSRTWIAREISKRSGYRMTAGAVKYQAVTRKISAMDAGGMFNVRAAADDMGVNEGSLRDFVRRRGLKVHDRGGKGPPVLLPPATMAACRLWFDFHTPQFLTAEEVAAHLKRPLAQVKAAIADGRLASVRQHGELRVPAAAVVAAVGVSLAKPRQARKAEPVRLMPCPECGAGAKPKGAAEHVQHAGGLVRRYVCEAGHSHRRRVATGEVVERLALKPTREHPWRGITARA